MTSRPSVLIILTLTIGISHGAPQTGLPGRYYQQQQIVGRYSPNFDSTSGQYVHDDSGSYYHDDSGSYNHDNSGAYVPDDNPYIHQADSSGNDYSGLGGSGGFGGSGRLGSGGSSTGSVDKPGSGIVPVAGSGLGSSSKPTPVVSGISPAGGYGQPVDLQQGNAAGLYDNRNYAIIRKIEQVEQDGYHYLYETENGIFGEEEGHLANKGAENEAIRATGYFTYTGPDNVVYTVEYTADENGFVPRGAHLPTPPPIPEAIARSLEYQRSIGEL